MKQTDPRQELDQLIQQNNDDYAALSRMLGRNPAYVQQFIKRGSPRYLGERERAILARYYGVDERVLGAPDPAPRSGLGLKLVPRLAVGASAGAGSLNDSDMLAGKVGFDEKWLRRLGVVPSQVALIRVEGDSMQPTLNDGDDIMVDQKMGHDSVKAGIYVLRMDDVLMVKRVKPLHKGHISVISDNLEYPSWPDLRLRDIVIIGKVIWVGRKL